MFVSDPVRPTEAGSIDTPGYAGDVAVAGDYAYVADSEGGLRVVDVSDPANPVETGSYDTPGLAYGVTVAGGYAYVAEAGYDNPGKSGLRVIDVSNPADPFEVGSYPTPGNATDVALLGDYAFLTDGEGGLRVIDVSDPANLSQVGYFDTPGFAEGVVLASSYAIVGVGDGNGQIEPQPRTYSPGGMIILNYTGVKEASEAVITVDGADPSLVGVPLTVRVKVSAGFGIPGGVVTVTAEGGAASCSGALVGGVASCQIVLNALGTYTLTAAYSGDKYFLPSIASPLEHSVVPPIPFYLPMVGE